MRHPARNFVQLLLLLPLGALLHFVLWRQRHGDLYGRSLLQDDALFGVFEKNRGKIGAETASNAQDGEDGGETPQHGGVDRAETAAVLEGAAAAADLEAHLAVSDDRLGGNAGAIMPLSPSDPSSLMSKTTEGAATTTTLCVRERGVVNPQQSIWKSVERFGSGRYRFVTPIDLRSARERGWEGGCDPSWPEVLSLADLEHFLRSDDARRDAVVLTFRRGDEKCRERDWRRWFRGIKPDFTTYWDSSDFSSSWNVTEEGSTAYLPLGPQFTFSPVDESEIVPPQRRRYLLNMIAALSTSDSRKSLSQILGKAGMSLMDASRMNFSHSSVEMGQEAMRILTKERLVVTPRKFQTVITRQRNATSGGYLSSEEFREALLQSVFTLCPAGRNPESYRIFEAAEAGSIPVVVLDNEYKTHGCSDSFLPFVESGAPFIFLSGWDKLEKKLAEIVSSPHLLEKRQAQVRNWYLKFMKRTSERIEGVLDSRLRTGLIDLPAFFHGNLLKGVSLPVVVVGLNKAGTSTIRDYFRCGGARTSHYLCGENDKRPLCAAMIKANIQGGRPPLFKTNDWEVYAEINSHKLCFFPQMESLDELHRHYPNATFILNLRNTTQWVQSVKNWGRGPNALPLKLVQCDLPGLPTGAGSKDEELAAWFDLHTERVRKFVSRHPSHRFVEVSIDSEEAGQVMEDNFGISAETCWGRSNVGRKRRKGGVQTLGEHNCSRPSLFFSDIPLMQGEPRKVDWERVCAPDKHPSARVPAFLIVGAQKAGTTAFFRQCAKHPRVRRPEWKEFHYFAGRNMLAQGTDTDTWKKNYRFMFGDVLGSKKNLQRCPSCITGEGTPLYMQFPNTVIPMVQKVSPWVKIVVMLRDPIARALSSFHMRKRNFETVHLSFTELVNEDFAKMEKAGLLQNWTDKKGWVDFDSFAGSKEEENALRRYEMTAMATGFSNRSSVVTSGIIFRGLYEPLLRQWIRAFGSRNMFVVNTDRERVGHQVCSRFHKFVGLEPIGKAETEKFQKDDSHDSRYSSELSNEMEEKLKKFFSPYNHRLKLILGTDWAGDVWRY